MNLTKRNLCFSAIVIVASLAIATKFADFIAGVVVQKAINSSVSKTVMRSILLKEHSPNTDTVVKPDKAYLLGTQNLAEKDFRLRTDGDGFILGSKNSDGPVDIIFLGGSTTECIYVDEALRFPYLVGQLLKDKSGNPVRTLNGGVSGNHTLHSFIHLVAKGLPYQPRIVVLMENVNDLVLLTKTGSYWKAPLSRALVQDPRASAEPKLPDSTVNPSQSANRPNAYWEKVKNFLFPNLWELFRLRFSNPETQLTEDEWFDFRNPRKTIGLERI